jgi:hypothetical protein
MKQESLFPTARTYLALFQVCSTTANVSQSMEILRDLLKADSPVAVSDQLVPASGARRYRFAPLPATTHRLAWTILSWMQDNGHLENVWHCTAYLKKALAVSRQDRDALNFITTSFYLSTTFRGDPKGQGER